MWVLIWIVTYTAHPGQPLFFESAADCRLTGMAIASAFDDRFDYTCIQVAGEVHS